MLVPTHGPNKADVPDGGRVPKETRMSYAESMLAVDEQILYRGRQHWLAPISNSLKPFVLVLVSLVLFFAELKVSPTGTVSTAWLAISAIVLLVGLVWIGIIFFTWRAQEYIITTRRVLKIEGLLDKKSGDSSLDKINDAVLKQGLLARILRYGDLEILTANEEGIDRYTMLAHAVDFKKAMLNAKNQLEDGYRGSAATPRTATAAPAAAPAAPAARSGNADDVTGTLAKLADLRDKGAIAPAEYEAKKAELLGRL
jgi:uncharacterized membrane protein YdbT with pleckstrin-like domain